MASDPPEWAREQVDALPLCGDGYPDQGDIETIARALVAAKARGIERAERAAKEYLDTWAADLWETFEGYIEAKKSGRHAGRRITPENADFYAKQFRERAEAVAGSADGCAAAIRKLQENGNDL